MAQSIELRFTEIKDDSSDIDLHESKILCCNCCFKHECWINGRCCCCLESCPTPQTQFILYNIVNIIRFMIIAFLIYLANHYNINETKEFWPSCCDCYYISKNPANYTLDISHLTRFDLSTCIPHCTNCNYCESRFNHSAQQSFDYNDSFCPLDTYQRPNSVINIDWYSKTGCHSRISLTLFKFFTKSYRTYGVLSFVFITVYNIALVVFISVAWCKCEREVDEFSRIILLYNVLIAEISLYLLFKPYQYWDKEFKDIGENFISVTCAISSTNNATRTWIVVMIFGLFTFVVIHIVIEVLICYKCFEKPGDSKHVTAEENDRLLTASSYTFEESAHITWIRGVIWFGIIFSLWIFIFLIALSIALYEMLYSYLFLDDNQHKGHSAIIISGAILILSAMVDALFCASPREWVLEYCGSIQVECKSCVIFCRGSCCKDKFSESTSEDRQL